MPSDPALRVVTFCNRAYLPVLANFLAAPHAPDRDDLVLYGLDPETRAAAEEAGIEARALDWSGDLATLWQARIDVFRALAAEGTDLIHTDADALWVGPGTLDWLTRDTDLAFSQGTVFPPEVHAATGFVLCCGLFRANATPATLRFLEIVGEDVARTGDDQVSVNGVLLGAGTVWAGAGTPDYRLRMRDTAFSCWKRPLTGTAPGLGLSVRLVPHSVVQRIRDPLDLDGRICVSHPLSPKVAGEKLDLFRDSGLLFIREDWRSLPGDAPLDAYRPG